jgi:hypothetical protein
VSTGWRPWYEVTPERWEREAEDLREAAATWEIDEEARSAGLLRLNPLRWPWNGGSVDLIADYPDYFPYFRPEVRAPTLHLPQHQSPRGNLCLLNRDTRNWDHQTLAELLKAQLKRVVYAATSETDEARTVEDPQAEPLSDYIPFPGWGMMLVDGSWRIPAGCTHGQLSIGLDPKWIGDGLRGAVLEVRGPAGELLGQSHKGIRRLFPPALRAPWTRVAEVPFYDDQLDMVTALLAVNPKTHFSSLTPVGGRGVAVVAYLFKEELAYQQPPGDSWLFAMEWAA